LQVIFGDYAPQPLIGFLNRGEGGVSLGAASY
jgi:hypothetical protein